MRLRTFIVTLPDKGPDDEYLRETVTGTGFAIGPSGSLNFTNADPDEEEGWPWTIAYADGEWLKVFEVNGLPVLGTEEGTTASGEENGMQGLSG